MTEFNLQKFKKFVFWNRRYGVVCEEISTGFSVIISKFSAVCANLSTKCFYCVIRTTFKLLHQKFAGTYNYAILLHNVARFMNTI